MAVYRDSSASALVMTGPIFDLAQVLKSSLMT